MRRLVFILLLLPLSVLGQVRVSTNIAHMLSLQPSPTQPWTDVEGYATPADWGAPKRFRWDATNTLATNAVIIAFPGRAEGRYVHDWDGDIRAFWILKTNDTTVATANTAAWNSMVDYATQNGQADHSEILLPRGQYWFNGTLRLYGSQWPNPGADFYTGRMSVKGQGQEQSWLMFDGPSTNNAIEIVQGRTSLEGFTVSGSAARKGSTNLITSYLTGHGILIREVVNAPAHCRIQDVVVRDQPNCGIAYYGPVEQVTCINVVAHDNNGAGFMASNVPDGGGTSLGATWHNTFQSCRALRNGRGGFAMTNIHNFSFLNSQSLDNTGIPHVVISGGRNNQLINCNIESKSSKISPVSPVTATNVVITFNTFTVPGFNPEAAGVVPGMHLIVSGSALNDRSYRVTGVTTTTVTTSTDLGTTAAESSTNSITLEFTNANVGLLCRGTEGTKVYGGYFGTLACAGIFYVSTNSFWDSPHCANANISNWTGDVTVMLAGSSSSNNIIRIHNYDPQGYRGRFRDLGANVGNSIQYGPDPQRIVLGRANLTTTPLEIIGGAGGAPLVDLIRVGVGGVGFTVAGSLGEARFNVIDTTNNKAMFNAQASAITPAFRLGDDGFATATHSNVLISPGRVANGVTTVYSNGLHMTLASGQGTGGGTSGVVKIASFDPHPTPGTQQTATRDIVGVTRSGMILTDGAGTLSADRMLGPSDFDTNQIFSVRSTTKVSAPVPFMTSAQKIAIVGSADGIVYDTTLNRLELRRNSAFYSIPRQVYFTATVDFASIAAGGFGFGSITSTAANTNDCIVLCKDLSLPITVEAAIATNGVILLRAFNPGGSSNDPPNSTYEGWIIKR